MEDWKIRWKKYCQGILTDNEWLELVALEYVLTWNYTTDYERDEKRHKELSDKKWNSISPPLKP